MTARLTARFRTIAALHPYGWSLTIIAIVTGVLWLIQQHINVENIALFYLVAVLLCAVTAGRTPAVFGAIISFLAFKFFFVEPIFGFSINDITAPWQLVSFVAAALITGAITFHAREQAGVARGQAHEMAILYDVSQSISAELDFERIAAVIVETTRQLLASPACQLLLTNSAGAHELFVTNGIWPNHNHAATATLHAGGQTLGVLRVALRPQQTVLNPKQRQLLETLANQAALALERSRLAQAAAHAEVLAASDRLKSTLISSVSHDLRTPLASITAAAEELLSDDVQWTATAVLDFAQIIKSEATQLSHVVMNMLDLTRIEAGVLHPQRGWYNVAEIVDHVLQRLASQLESHPIELRVPDDLPLIPVDYVQLEQVIWNVLQNALKYTPPASPLMIETGLHATSMLLSIGDRGPGIPASERVRVFEKFYRLPQTQQTGLPGAGLGLAICKGLVEAQGGEIAILDRDGGGTLVTIRLPLQADADAKERTSFHA